jgi:cell division protein FtsB
MVRAFVLGMVLLAIVGVCTVRETNKQIQARYELEQLTRREDEAKKRLARLRTDEQALRSPARLAKLVRDKRLDVYALPHAAPAVAKAGKERRPGEVLEEDAGTMDLAGAF